MSIKATSSVVAAAFLFVASGLGVMVIPKFGHIFADMLPGQPLPWSTRLVLSAGPAGFVAFALVGAALLALTGSLSGARWVHRILIIALALTLAFTLVALLLPLDVLLERAEPTV